MPGERLELSRSLQPRVFETRAYTIPPPRQLRSKNIIPYPFSSCSTFKIFFSRPSSNSVINLFFVNHFPWYIFFCIKMKTIVVLIDSSCEIICYADVCFWIITTFEYIDKVHKISAYTRLDSKF